MGGSPCQGFSFAGKQLNFEDPRSRLFFEFVRVLKEIKPKYFLLENVSMKQEYQDIITDHLGVKPIVINSNMFSAQTRTRLYWTNIPIEPYTDKKIKWVDVEEIDGPHLDKYQVNQTPSRKIMWGGGLTGKCPNLSIRDKSWCLTTKKDRWNNAGLVARNDFCRFITPLEAERLQTLPDGYTEGISDTRRYHAIGNGWTVDVLAHIFKGIET